MTSLNFKIGKAGNRVKSSPVAPAVEPHEERSRGFDGTHIAIDEAVDITTNITKKILDVSSAKSASIDDDDDDDNASE
jgi:hypothetical protein